MRPGLTNMKLSRFVPYYAGADERGTIAKAREDSFEKRDALTAMRAALLEMVPESHSGYRTSDPAELSADTANTFNPGKIAPVAAQER
ncbi:hypothetical protein SPHINGOT1_10041 [Sphingomonas sp. T1]|nr:hypothetical protein SPHINGOT1_10041 [Sphingomonas sp. T1]